MGLWVLKTDSWKDSNLCLHGEGGLVVKFETPLSYSAKVRNNLHIDI